MYIWILLATIMVALSFFNVAPRADKEHALNNVKAATIINRFNAEHSARLHTIECEIIYNQSTQQKNGGAGWDGAVDGVRNSASGPVDVSNYEPAYTTFKSYLPVGYAIGNNRKDGSGSNYSTSGMKQFVYCLADTIETEYTPSTPNNKVFVACNEKSDDRALNIGDHRYLVSFAPIPDRWVSKDASKTPLPTFVNLLSTIPGASASFGWLEWVDGKPKLHGVGAAASRAIKLKDKDHTFDDKHKDLLEQRLDDNYNYKEDLKDSSGNASTQARNEKYVSEVVIIPDNSALWRNSAFDSVCKTGNPCMIAFEPFPKTDPACHCYNLIRDAFSNRINLQKCYNDVYDASGSRHVTNVDKINVFTEQTYQSQSERYTKFKDYLR